MFHKDVSYRVNSKPEQPAGAAAQGGLFVRKGEHQPVPLDLGQGSENTGFTLPAAAPSEVGRSCQAALASPCTAV